MCAVPEALPNVCMLGDQNAVHLNGENKTWLGMVRGGTKERQICNSHEGRVRLTGQSVLSVKAHRMTTSAFYYILSLTLNLLAPTTVGARINP